MSASDRLDPVRRYYQDRGEAELHRLDNPFEGAIEREIHRRALGELVPAGARVLDLGGGPGHWTGWLLRRGHRVVLADLSPRMLDLARRELGAQGLEAEAIVECDARDLSRFDAADFDVVLAMGPFYHLVAAADRRRARDEVARVLKPGGRLLATVMMRYAWLLTAQLSAPMEGAAMRTILEGGEYHSPVAGPLTAVYLFRAEEVVPFFEGGGLSTLRLMASQGFLNQVQEPLAELREINEQAYQDLVAAAYEAASDPSILGLSGHLLYAGEKAATATA